MQPEPNVFSKALQIGIAHRLEHALDNATNETIKCTICQEELIEMFAYDHSCDPKVL
jgi:hypothetical protein